MIVEIISLSKANVASDYRGKVIDLPYNLKGLTFINILHNDYKIISSKFIKSRKNECPLIVYTLSRQSF